MFQLQNLFHSGMVDPNTCSHSLFPVIHFELSAVKWSSCCALFGLCVFLSCSTIRKKKTLSHGQTKNQVFSISEMVATRKKLNAWSVNQELTCLWQTRVLLIFESM
jgi:hypothetical protein